MDTTNPTPQARCRTLFAAAIRTVDELRRCGLDGHTSRALLLVPTALLRPSELVSPAVMVRDGSLHVPGRAVGPVNLQGRTVPLGGAARAVLGDEGSLHELLGVGRHGRGPFLRTLSAAYASAAPEGLETLEQLWAALTAAALAAQPSGPERSAVTRYAALSVPGQPTQQDAALAQRVARYLDTQVKSCGYRWDGEPGSTASAPSAPGRAA
jgi:hypothetical protein